MDVRNNGRQGHPDIDKMGLVSCTWWISKFVAYGYFCTAFNSNISEKQQTVSTAVGANYSSFDWCVHSTPPCSTVSPEGSTGQPYEC